MGCPYRLRTQGEAVMKTRPRLASVIFLVGAFLMTVAVLSAMGTLGWGLTGLLQ